MTVGLRIRNRTTGAVTFEVTDRLTRVLGSVYTGSVNGAIAVPAFSQGIPWAYANGIGNQNLFSFGQFPKVTISGTILSWTFVGISGREIYPDTILYGVY